MRHITVAEHLSRYAVWIGGAMMIFAALLVTVDVILRKFLSMTLGGADEISGYLFGIATAWAFSYALLHRVNVRIDALYLHFPAPVRAILDIVGLMLLALFVGVLTWRATLLFQDSLSFWSKSITPLQTPLAIPQFLWLAGLYLFFVTILLVLFTALAALLRGDVATVQRLTGVRTLDEEMAEETQGMIDRGAGD